jgi:hypothetical protein
VCLPPASEAVANQTNAPQSGFAIPSLHDGLDAGPKEVDMSQSIAIAMAVLAAELETAEAALAGNSSDAEHEALYGLAEAARDVIEVWGS